MSWKTIFINIDTKLSLELNCLKIKNNDQYLNVPISDIQTVIVDNEGVVLTVPLISKLIENNVCIIICNNYHDPVGIFQPFNTHSLVFKQLNLQLNWKTTLKKGLWKIVIKEKIKTEISVIKKIKGINSNVLEKYYNEVKSNDSTNREGMAAKYYFNELFGKEFVRHSESNINYALNYGYKILASFISKYIASRGLLTQLGIFHKGSSNAFNLTYDFIEVFRFIVDIWVYYNIEEETIFNSKHKIELINLTNCKIKYNFKTCRVSNVIECVINDYIKFLNGEIEKVIFPSYDTIDYESN